MVSKKVIAKLSDRELENYIKPDSRFVEPAISYAYEILQARGRVFSDNEKMQIQQMINAKSEAETKDRKKYYKAWDENLTEEESAIELYSNKMIWIFSILFGVFFGGFLHAINFYKLENRKAAIIFASFGILFSICQVLLLQYFENSAVPFIKSSYFPFLLSGIGAMALIYIRDHFAPKDLKYKSRSFLIPLVVALIIYIPLAYLMFLRILQKI